MRTLSLGEVAQWGSGGTPKRGNPAYFGPGVPWLSIADLNDGVVHSAKESLTNEGIANSSAKVVPPGTLFVAMYGSIGKLGIAGTDMATSQAIAFAKPNDELVDRRYLFHYLLAQRPRLQSLGRGGTQMNIGQADLKAWPIPMPPLPEQRRIAAILDQADVIRTKRRQVLAHLDSLTQSIFHDMFGGEARTSTLGELADVQIGPFGSLLHKEDYVVGGISLINPIHIRNHSIIPDAAFSIPEDKASKLALYRLQEGDVVMGRRGEMGRAGIATASHDGLICGTGSLILRPRGIGTEFLHAVVTSPRMKGHLEKNALGATLPNLNAAIVKNAPAPNAEAHRQHDFAARVARVSAVRSATWQTQAADGELFASLQSRAFRGEL